jgi:hypothetical protein
MGVEKVKKKATGDEKSNKPKQINFSIGCTVGRDTKPGEINEYMKAGINIFQYVAEYSREGSFRSPPAHIVKSGAEIIFHMPFYFHLLLQRSNTRTRLFSTLNSSVSKWNRRVQTIVHCKGNKRIWPGRLKVLMYEYLRHYAKISPNLIICLENDAGGKDNKAPRLTSILRTVRSARSKGIENVGICMDTEHAYAAGESMFSIGLEEVDIIHLNSIPKQVKFGGHLDRHSLTPLAESKIGTGFVRKILAKSNNGQKIILERTKREVILRDLKYIKGVKRRLENV